MTIQLNIQKLIFSVTITTTELQFHLKMRNKNTHKKSQVVGFMTCGYYPTSLKHEYPKMHHFILPRLSVQV